MYIIFFFFHKCKSVQNPLSLCIFFLRISLCTWPSSHNSFLAHKIHDLFPQVHVQPRSTTQITTRGASPHSSLHLPVRFANRPPTSQNFRIRVQRNASALAFFLLFRLLPSLPPIPPPPQSTCRPPFPRHERRHLQLLVQACARCGGAGAFNGGR